MGREVLKSTCETSSCGCVAASRGDGESDILKRQREKSSVTKKESDCGSVN